MLSSTMLTDNYYYPGFLASLLHSIRTVLQYLTKRLDRLYAWLLDVS